MTLAQPEEQGSGPAGPGDGAGNLRQAPVASLTVLEAIIEHRHLMDLAAPFPDQARAGPEPPGRRLVAVAPWAREAGEALQGRLAQAALRRPLKDAYKVLMLDGVELARKTRARAQRRPVLVALGLRLDGKKEIIDFHLAASESALEWERFLTDLYRRGLTGTGLDMICVDGGQGLLAALPTVFHAIPVQRCWAHKIRNVLNKVRQADQPALTHNN